MTVFLGSPALTTVAPLVSKDKGSLGNRINCAGSQAWNAIETGATAAGVVTIADYGLRHKDKLSKTYNGTKNIAQKIANSSFGQTVANVASMIAAKAKEMFKNTNIYKKAGDFISRFKNKLNTSKWVSIANKAAEALKNFGNKAINVLKNLPKGGKIGLLVALGLTILNGVYKSGQIDQKYTDRAEMEKHFV